ncbi:hypothetical protein HPB47_003635, partial [Ixodes persulcatus]
MGKLVNLWLFGPLAVRLGPSQRQEVSEKSLSLSTHMPTEFVRKPRRLAYP